MDNRTYRRLVALHLVAGLPLAGVLNLAQPETPPPDADGFGILRTWADAAGVALPPDIGNVKAALDWLPTVDAKYNTAYVAGGEPIDIAADDPRVTGQPPAAPAPVAAVSPPVPAAAPDASSGAPAAPVTVPAPSQPISSAPPPAPAVAPAAAPLPVEVPATGIDPQSDTGRKRLDTLTAEARRLRAVLLLPAEVMPDHYKGLLLRGLVDAFGPTDIGAMLGILAVTSAGA